MTKLIIWIFQFLRMDNLTPEQRKKNMKNIRSENTKPERIIINELSKRNIEFMVHPKDIIGKPDLVLFNKKVAIFIDSDFWHGNPERLIMPKSNRGYWEKKIERNRQRDKEVNMTLKSMGWQIIRLWEYDIEHDLDNCMNKILQEV